ncbi:MAG: uroporphyrinogen-III synthase [Thiotrichaceae bacterium]
MKTHIKAQIKPLLGCSILVTRPQHQAESFCQMLEHAGATVFRFPTIEVKATTPNEQSLDALMHLNQQDILLFTSSNAVHFCLPWLKPFISTCSVSTPSKKPKLPFKIAAIGKKTAQALEQQHLHVDIFPEDVFNSERLLALPEMQTVANKSILIIKGRGGRSILHDGLQRRGANIKKANVYCRQRPTPDIEVLNALKSQKIDIITLTSAESGKNLFAMLKNELPAWSSASTLLLGSKRIHQAIYSSASYNSGSYDDKKTKATHPFWIAKNPSDDAMFTALLEWKKQHIERL